MQPGSDIPMPDMPVPDISVVIPAHNAQDTIESQLDALLSQITQQSFEIVIVNNASTDNTPVILQRYVDRDTRIRVVGAHGGAGPSYARNTGIRAARSALIACCDADDIVAENWIDAMHAGLSTFDAIAGVLDVDRLNPERVITARGASVPGTAGTFEGVTFAHGCNLGIRRDTFLHANGFNEALRAGEEIDLAIRLRTANVEVHEWPSARVHYRFRHDARSQWHQAFEGGRIKPHLCKMVRTAGLATPKRTQGLRNWLWLFRTLPRLRDPSARLRWLWVLASRCGQIAGCWRYRSVYI